MLPSASCKNSGLGRRGFLAWKHPEPCTPLSPARLPCGKVWGWTETLHLTSVSSLSSAEFFWTQCPHREPCDPACPPPPGVGRMKDG